MSRDALEELTRKMDVREVFNRPKADLLSRFPMPSFWTRSSTCTSIILDGWRSPSTPPLEQIPFIPVHIRLR